MAAGACVTPRNGQNSSHTHTRVEAGQETHSEPTQSSRHKKEEMDGEGGCVAAGRESCGGIKASGEKCP